MKFKFGLQTLLKHRGRVEDEARRKHLEAKAALNHCLGEIKRMYDSIDETRESIAREQTAGGGNHLEMIRQMELFIKGTQIRIQSERIRARELMQKVEAALEELVEASKDRKILDKLKSRRWEEFRAEVKRKEDKDIDELVTTRFKKRGIS